MRYTGNVVAANVAAAAMLLSFVSGSLTHVLSLPDAPQASAVAQTDVSTPASSAAAASAAAPAPAVQADAALTNVSSHCKNAAATNAVDAVGAIDVFTSDADSIRAADGVSLDEHRRYDLEGWAASRDSKTPAVAACLVVDGRVASQAVDLYGVRRVDVANALGSTALSSSGYRIVIPKNALAVGNHTVRISVLERDGSYAYIGPKSVQIAVQ